MDTQNAHNKSLIIMIFVVFGGAATVVAGLLQAKLLASGLAVFPTVGFHILGHGLDWKWLKWSSYLVYAILVIAMVAFAFFK